MSNSAEVKGANQQLVLSPAAGDRQEGRNPGKFATQIYSTSQVSEDIWYRVLKYYRNPVIFSQIMLSNKFHSSGNIHLFKPLLDTRKVHTPTQELEICV